MSFSFRTFLKFEQCGDSISTCDQNQSLENCVLGAKNETVKEGGDAILQDCFSNLCTKVSDQNLFEFAKGKPKDKSENEDLLDFPDVPVMNSKMEDIQGTKNIENKINRGISKTVLKSNSIKDYNISMVKNRVILESISHPNMSEISHNELSKGSQNSVKKHEKVNNANKFESEELKTMNEIHKHTAACYASKWNKQAGGGCSLFGKKNILKEALHNPPKVSHIRS